MVIAETIRVPLHYPTISEAIDAANDGDVVRVAPGTYHEAIDFQGKTIVVRSNQGADETTIDATGLGTSAVRIASGEGDGTQLLGFTITGGSGQYFIGEIMGGGLFTMLTSPLIKDCVFQFNEAEGSGGGMALFGGSPDVRNCNFFDNSAGTGEGGGAIATSANCDARIANCLFYRNSATFAGGAISNLGSLPTIVNCVFIGNEAALGGAVRSSLSDTQVINCTFLSNTAQFGGGVRSTSGGIPVVQNSVFLSNYPDDVQEQAGSVTTVEFCCLQMPWEGAGSNNIVANPRFIDPRGPDGVKGTGDENVRPLLNSPCIDAGSNDLVPSYITWDADGRTRILDSDSDGVMTVEIGAYEAPANDLPADLNGDGVVDAADLLLLLTYWGECSDESCIGDLDGDGIVGVSDMLALLEYWDYVLLGNPFPTIELFLGPAITTDIESQTIGAPL